ncbi:unnamed protein product [Closterium sp. NIES-54]
MMPKTTPASRVPAATIERREKAWDFTSIDAEDADICLTPMVPDAALESHRGGSGTHVSAMQDEARFQGESAREVGMRELYGECTSGTALLDDGTGECASSTALLDDGTGECASCTAVLDDDTLSLVLSFLPSRFAISSAAFVCRRWCRVALRGVCVRSLPPSPFLLDNLTLEGSESTLGSFDSETELLKLTTRFAATLRSLEIPDFTSTCVEHVASTLPHLTALSLWSNAITWEMVSLLLALLPSLKRLSLVSGALDPRAFDPRAFPQPGRAEAERRHAPAGAATAQARPSLPASPPSASASSTTARSPGISLPPPPSFSPSATATAAVAAAEAAAAAAAAVAATAMAPACLSHFRPPPLYAPSMPTIPPCPRGML